MENEMICILQPCFFRLGQKELLKTDKNKPKRKKRPKKDGIFPSKRNVGALPSKRNVV